MVREHLYFVQIIQIRRIFMFTVRFFILAPLCFVWNKKKQVSLFVLRLSLSLSHSIKKEQIESNLIDSRTTMSIVKKQR